MSDKRYQIEVTEGQYNTIAMCVDVCHRISCGDVWEINQILPITIDRNLLAKIKREAFPELAWNAQYKWCGGYRNPSKSEEFCKAFGKFQAQTYAIYREMYHQRNLINGINNVYTSDTLTCEEGGELPKIKVIE